MIHRIFNNQRKASIQIALSVLCCITTLLIQSCEPGSYIGASLDLSHGNFDGPSYVTDEADEEPNVGFNIGYTFMLGLGDHHNNAQLDAVDKVDDFIHFGLLAGAEFVQKNYGAKYKTSKEKYNLSYVEVPLYAVVRHQLATKDVLFGGIGAYAAYGVSGKYKSTSNMGQTFSSKVFDKSGGFYKRFDGGLALTAGYEKLNSFSFSLAYDYGLANLERYGGSGGDKAKNRTFSLNVRYPLDKLVKR